MKPSRVRKADEERLRKLMFPKPKIIKNPSLKIGDMVRIAVKSNIFAKEYLPKFSEEVFIIAKIKEKHQPYRYVLNEWDNKTEIRGSFYAAELQKVDPDVFVVEKILRRKNINGTRHVLVKWRGFSNKYNSWQRASDVE